MRGRLGSKQRRQGGRGSLVRAWQGLVRITQRKLADGLGLPKCATDCPGVDWLVGFWPREITGIPLGSPVAKVGHSDFIFPSGEAVVEA